MTVDPIDWSHPPPSWAVPPERLLHSINQCNLSGNRTCNRSMRGNHLAYAAIQVIPHSNRAGKKDLANWDVLQLDTSNSSGLSGMSNSSRSRWKLAEQTGIRVRINLIQHTKPSHTTSMTQRQETLIGTKPGHRIHLALNNQKVIFSS